MFNCKGICGKYLGRYISKQKRYGNGQWRCSICDCYLTKEGLNGVHCSCCGARVRQSPRSRRFKKTALLRMVLSN